LKIVLVTSGILKSLQLGIIYKTHDLPFNIPMKSTKNTK